MVMQVSEALIGWQAPATPKPEPKPLGAIVKKLWQVLKVNKLLLAFAVVSMVALPLGSLPSRSRKCLQIVHLFFTC